MGGNLEGEMCLIGVNLTDMGIMPLVCSAGLNIPESPEGTAENRPGIYPGYKRIKEI
jgi:hypothetical protein